MAMPVGVMPGRPPGNRFWPEVRRRVREARSIEVQCGGQPGELMAEDASIDSSLPDTALAACSSRMSASSAPCKASDILVATSSSLAPAESSRKERSSVVVAENSSMERAMVEMPSPSSLS